MYKRNSILLGENSFLAWRICCDRKLFLLKNHLKPRYKVVFILTNNMFPISFGTPFVLVLLDKA